MEEKIIFRPFRNSDDKALENIIRETWNFDKLCPPKEAGKMARLYLYNCLANQTFTCVAEKDGKPVGIIMACDVKNHRCPPGIFIKRGAALLQMAVSARGRKTLSMFGKVEKIDQRLVDKIGVKYPGEISFFAVDSGCRGLGLGRKLFEKAENYLKLKGISHCFLYTDTSCNYRFYEHMGLERKARESVSVGGNDMTFFIYEYSLPADKAQNSRGK